MERGITLHPQYGLNPTIPICFYCGKERNEIALLGRGYRGEAPMNMVIDIEPCDECKENYAEYTLLVEARHEYDHRAWGSRQLPPKPTGRWLAIKKDCLNVPPTPIAFVEPATMNELLSKIPAAVSEV